MDPENRSAVPLFDGSVVQVQWERSNRQTLEQLNGFVG
jgi:hypothetical protein